MASVQVGRAKQDLTRWFDRVHHSDQSTETKAVRRRLLAGLERVLTELPARESWREVITREYQVDGLPKGTQEILNGAVVSTGDRLLVTTILPGWGFGWQSFLKDEYTYDTLSWLLHYARQHIHRASITQVILATYDLTEIILHPFDEKGLFKLRFSDRIPYPGDDGALRRAWLSAGVGEEGLEQGTIFPDECVWLRANMLDPAIGQAASNYLRGLSLGATEHHLDAVVAFDCVVQSAAFYLQQRGRLAKDATRSQICAALRLDEVLQHSSEFAYFVRNNFGAHPRGWRWWDVNEILNDEIPGAQNVARATLESIAEDEAGNRKVEPSPQNWATWLLDNFSLVFDAVWFDELAAWERDHPRPPAEEDA